MGRQSKRLTARTVASLKTPGRHADGDRLYLSIEKNGAGRRWVFLYALDGKQRELGLGSANVISLAQARARAAELRDMLAKGIDPFAAKRAAVEARKTARTFGECARELIASKRSAWRSKAHAGQWETTLATYCAALRDKPIDEIDTAAVLAVLKPIWQAVPETASRLRGRIEAVLDFGKAHGLRSGENPAAWRGHLALILPKRGKLSRGHHAALDYRDVPGFVGGTLRQTESIAARALEFLILTASRAGEVRGARWDEIDFDAKVWTIPAVRMKAALLHRVPLSARAIAILEQLAEYRTCDFVFPGRRRQPIGKMAMSLIVPKGATTHGFRSSFSISNVEAAYRRSDALERRRALMDAWAAYVDPATGGNIVQLRQQANGI